MTGRRTFTRAELESFRDAVVPDLLGPDLRLLFVGINPGLWTAATQTHFAHPGNRSTPRCSRAGSSSGGSTRCRMSDDDRNYLRDRGIGITNIVRRATAKASELTAEELRHGGERLVETIRRTAPQVVAVAGITAYRTAFAHPKAVPGRQPEALGRRRALGGAEPERAQRQTVSSLATAYAAAARAAGVL